MSPQYGCDDGGGCRSLRARGFQTGRLIKPLFFLLSQRAERRLAARRNSLSSRRGGNVPNKCLEMRIVNGVIGECRDA